MGRNFFYCVLVAVVLVTPFSHSEGLYNGVIAAKQIWFYAAMALLILFFGIDMLFRKKGTLLSVNLIDIALLAFYPYFLIRSIFTPFTPLLYNTRFFNYSLLLIFYFIVKYFNANWANNKTTPTATIDKKENSGPKIFIDVLVVFLMLTGLVQAIWGLLQLYGFLPSFHPGFKITGTFFNPAPYALYLAVIFPMALGRLLLIKKNNGERIKDLNASHISSIFSYCLQFFKSLTPSYLINKISRSVSFLTVIAIVLVLPATMNRASWIGVAAGSFIVLNNRYGLLKRVQLLLNNTSRKLLAFAIIILVVGLSGAGLYHLKKGSSDGRLLIWEVTLGKIAEKPLFGYGVGRFEAEYNNWQAEYFQSHQDEMDGTKGMVAGNTKYCFNEYLEIAAELGLIGLLFFVFVLVSPFIPQRAGPRSKWKTSSSLTDLTTPSLIALLVCGTVSFPLYSLPTQILFYVFLALISISAPTVASVQLPVKFNYAIRITGVILLFAVFIFLYRNTKKEYISYKAMNEAVMLYQLGSYDDSCKSFSGLYANMGHKGTYLQYYAKALLMAGRYEESIKIYWEAKDQTGDDMLYCSMGDAYKAMKRYDLARDTYMQASFMVPHKLYPLYLLAVLYEDSGETSKAVEVAKKVLNKNVKIESDATIEIQYKMKRIIESQQTKF